MQAATHRVIGLSAILFCSVLTACGGGDGGGDASPNPGDTSEPVFTGIFVDSAVEGLTYATPTLNGTTDAEGTFQYRQNESVSFYLGETLLGTTHGKEVISPMDLMNAGRPASITEATNISRLLQSLDEDNDPSNGINLIDAARSLGKETFSAMSEPGTAQLLEQIAPDRTLVSEETAQSHLSDTLATVNGNLEPETAYTSYAHSDPVSGLTPVEDYKYAAAQIDIGDAGNGQFLIQGSMTRANGTVETFEVSNAANSFGFFNSVTNLGSTVNFYLGKHYGRIEVSGNWINGSRIFLTTNPEENLEPFMLVSLPTTDICLSAEDNYSVTRSFWAYDEDGYLVRKANFTFQIDGQPQVTLVGNPGSTFDRLLSVDDMFTVTLKCTQGFTWSYIIEDNEGAVRTISGTVPAQFDAVTNPDVPTAADGHYCMENYDGATCNYLISNPPDNILSNAETIVSSHPQGSCSSLVPGATIVSWDDNNLDLNISNHQYIADFTGSGADGNSSCLLTYPAN